jgi:hypothetical protein
VVRRYWPSDVAPYPGPLRLSHGPVRGRFHYVDTNREGVAQQKLVGDTINGTFPEADSDEKRCTPGPAQEVLGWDADLRSATVNPNIKGREKLLLYFFTFNTNRPHSAWKRLASLVERCSAGCAELSPSARSPCTNMNQTHEHIYDGMWAARSVDGRGGR